jgi:hypothetical protein
MVDIITLARKLRSEFQTPVNYGEIYALIAETIGEEPDQETEIDAYKALSAKWKRDSWAWNNDVGAVKTLEGENVVFDEDAITIAKGHGGSTMVVSLARGEHHDRVKWF